MKIKETKSMPNPGGFGWGEYTQVRELGSDETMPSDAVAAADTDDVTGWARAGEAKAPDPAAAPAAAALSATNNAVPSAANNLGGTN